MQQNERLSAYVDGEETGFAQELVKSSDLQQKWASYHAIRNVMQGEEMILGADFSEKMAALIEEETIEAKPRGLLVKLKRWSVPLMQAGIAASVCLVAVFGVNYVNQQKEMANATPALVTEPFSNGVEAVSYNAPAKDLATPEKLAQQEQRVQMIMNNQSIEPTRTAQHAELSNEEKAKAQTSANKPVEQPQK